MIGPKKPRKRHVQQALVMHGGKRKGSGRKPKGTRAGAEHKKRPKISAKNGLHVVLRVVPEVGNLRRPQMYAAIRQASIAAAMRERIRIVHVSIQRTHIHMIVEAENKKVLSRGMQGFQISAARHVNAALGIPGRPRRGSVFVDRYHLVVITSPTQARHALSYLLNNWRKHAEDRDRPSGLIDRFSSGCSFPDWRELDHADLMWKIPPDHDPLVVYRPRSWLLRTGWKLVGSISAREVPGRRR
ncbi:MAG: transposase [Kofleriaceae bacterium]